MSTRKSTLASPTAQGTKVENASSSSTTSSTTAHTTKALDKTNASSSTADKAEMGANASANTNIVNTLDPKTTEQKTNQETKPFQQRVTRNSPLLLGGITIKKEPIDPSEHHTNSESEEVGGAAVTANTKKNIRGRKSIKEHKELTEKEDKQEDAELQKGKDKDKEDCVKEESGEKKDHKEISEQKEKETTNTNQTSATTASNRLTRKSVATQETTNTRVTRQRQSSGASARSETPPARSRSARNLARGKMPVPMIEPATNVTKRKRSVDADNATTANKSCNDEPGPKYIKIEVKDPDLENEDVLPSSQNTNASSEGIDDHTNIKIKQEIVDESENEMPAVAESISNSTTTTSRAKTRCNTRKSTSNTTTTTSTNNSPSTRATRQTKQNSPIQSSAPATENKRRRMGSQTRSLLKPNVGSNAKNQPVNGEEEDSKDSTASSTNTDDIVLALIKSEKISMELDDDNTNDAKDVEKEEDNKATKNSEENLELQAPLVVDTEVAATNSTDMGQTVETAAALTPVAASCSSLASGSEKAASLSPSDLVSEGVSEISVKQFYKKPKFLENNLGIEEDPKLGNIVQKVAGLETPTTVEITTTTDLSTTTTTTAKVTTATATTSSIPEVRILDDSFSNESLKEGTLRFEESIDDKKSVTQDEGNSLSSSDNLTPLLIVEDDEEEEEVIEEPLNDKKNEVQIVETKLEVEQTKTETLSVAEEKENVKPITIDVDEDETVRDQEDELTLEESETISMDNNASINDEVITEIEDPTNEDITNENEDITQLPEVIEQISELTEANNHNLEEEKSNELIEDNKETKEEDIPLTITMATSISNITAAAAEDEDNDVLAKIDAELKKIDERNKEKLIVTPEENKSSDVIIPDTVEEAVKISIDDFIIGNESMDVDGDVLPETIDDVKNITKDDSTIDDVLDIKLDEQQPIIIAEDMKLLEEKCKEDNEEEVGIASDMDSLLKDEKMDVKNDVIKVSCFI